jgi:phospholipid/cholesterol/gamma-HCH transport system substrate-binding protein
VVEVQESPIGLGSMFIFYPGKGTELIPDGNVIPEVNAPEAKQYIARGLTDVTRTSDSIGNIVNQVNAILDTVNKALAGQDGELPLDQIINNVEGITANIKTITDSLSDQLQPLVANLELVTEKISAPSGAVMSILDGKGPLYEGINSLAGIIENLNKTSEFIPAQLPQIAAAINELNIVLRQVQDVLTGIANNPLIKDGIPKGTETGPTGVNPRDQQF